jgi:hypothetical protein
MSHLERRRAGGALLEAEWLPVRNSHTRYLEASNAQFRRLGLEERHRVQLPFVPAAPRPPSWGCDQATGHGVSTAAATADAS